MNEDSNNEEPEIDEAGDNWWNSSSLSSVRAEFREALSNAEPPFTEVTGPWLQYWVTANARGLTRGASKALLLLIEQVLKRGGSIDDLTESSPSEKAGVCRFFARALVALSEQTGIVLPRLDRVEREIASYAASVGLGESDAAAIRMSNNTPLGRAPTPEDLRALRDDWRQYKTDSYSRGTSAAFCESALGQILVENLILAGEVDEALEIAKDATNENPCMSGCALAPQAMLSVCLEPLRQQGDLTLARSWEKKLASVAPPGHSWMAPAGARVAFLAKTGAVDEALQLIEDTDRFTREPQTSAWQRFAFFRGASEALLEMGRESESISFDRRARELALAFDRRNGNETASATLLN